MFTSFTEGKQFSFIALTPGYKGLLIYGGLPILFFLFFSQGTAYGYINRPTSVNFFGLALVYKPKVYPGVCASLSPCGGHSLDGLVDKYQV